MMNTVSASLTMRYGLKSAKTYRELVRMRRMLEHEAALEITDALYSNDADLQGDKPEQVVGKINNLIAALDSPFMLAHRLALISEAPEEQRAAMTAELFRDMTADLKWRAKRVQELSELDYKAWLEG